MLGVTERIEDTSPHSISEVKAASLQEVTWGKTGQHEARNRVAKIGRARGV